MNDHGSRLLGLRGMTLQPLVRRARDLETAALDRTALPLPPGMRDVLRTIADDVRRPPAGITADPIALRRWLDEVARRLEGVARASAGAEPSPASVARYGVASPRAAMSPENRSAGLVVETRRRPGRG